MYATSQALGIILPLESLEKHVILRTRSYNLKVMILASECLTENVQNILSRKVFFKGASISQRITSIHYL